MANPGKVPKLDIKLFYGWYGVSEDQFLFVNYIQVGARKFHFEGVLIDLE